MEQTWLTIAASLLMGLGAAGIFIWAVKRDHFQDLEETKYQVFWSDVEELVCSSSLNSNKENDTDGGSNGSKDRKS